jgi:hypothetical protein
MLILPNKPENRQHKRLDIAMPLTYLCADHNADHSGERLGVTANVSSGGVYFYPRHYDQHLSVNQVLNLSINSCRQDHKEPSYPWVHLVKARGKIVRLDKLAATHGVALQFLEPPSVS